MLFKHLEIGSASNLAEIFLSFQNVSKCNREGTSIFFLNGEGTSISCAS